MNEEPTKLKMIFIALCIAFTFLFCTSNVYGQEKATEHLKVHSIKEIRHNEFILINDEEEVVVNRDTIIIDVSGRRVHAIKQFLYSAGKVNVTAYKRDGKLHATKIRETGSY